MGQPARAAVLERTTYEPQWPSEAFIVPLLRGCIEEGIARYASPAPHGARGLDVGCGGQPFRGMLESIGYVYTGFDVQQNPAGAVHVLGAIDAPLPGELVSRGPFHFTLCTEVLEHVALWDAAFANLAQIMAPGGRLLLTCPHFYPPHEEPYDFWRPTPHAVEFHARRVGLHPVEVRRVGDAWDILGTLLAVTRFRARRVGPADYVLAALAQLARRVVAAVLRMRGVRHRIRVRGPMYLSTVAVFEKPA